ncbi:MAG TPA: hemolysin III family protein [Bacteriovoracaceae bacterium]|nr:hemolysin III family protein [Bacteriovoracaceae bacterium]
MKPILRGHFHEAMFYITLGACLMLIARTESSTELWATIAYTLGTLTMFGISALYHRITWSPKSRALMRKLDHCGIYIMIAATFTPVTLLALSPESGRTLFISIWTVAVLGILQSIFFINLPKWVSAILYLIAGYMILPYVPELGAKLSTSHLWLLIGGGIVYSLGALAYGLKKPVLSPKYFGYHEVFHVLVSIAAIMHFLVVYSLV